MQSLMSDRHETSSFYFCVCFKEQKCFSVSLEFHGTCFMTYL